MKTKLLSLFVWFILFQEGSWYWCKDYQGSREKWFHVDFAHKYSHMFIFPESSTMGGR